MSQSLSFYTTVVAVTGRRNVPNAIHCARLLLFVVGCIANEWPGCSCGCGCGCGCGRQVQATLFEHDTKTPFKKRVLDSPQACAHCCNTYVLALEHLRVMQMAYIQCVYVPASRRAVLCVSCNGLV